MSTLLGPDGEPLNPAEYFQLVPDTTIDAIYDAFDTDLPMSWLVEWTGLCYELIVFGWVSQTTDEGYEYAAFEKAGEIPKGSMLTISRRRSVEIPKGYVHVADQGSRTKGLSNER